MASALQPLLDPARPAVEYGEVGPTGADTLHALSGEGVLVRVVRGSRAPTQPAFFDELAAALQLPPHFGANWNALTDALRDIEGSIVIVVTGAGELLVDAGDQALATLLDVVTSVDHERRQESGDRVRLLLTEAMDGLWRIRPRLLALDRPMGLADFEL